jgi:hypothetical protein
MIEPNVSGAPVAAVWVPAPQVGLELVAAAVDVELPAPGDAPLELELLLPQADIVTARTAKATVDPAARRSLSILNIPRLSSS